MRKKKQLPQGPPTRSLPLQLREDWYAAFETAALLEGKSVRKWLIGLGLAALGSAGLKLMPLKKIKKGKKPYQPTGRRRGRPKTKTTPRYVHRRKPHDKPRSKKNGKWKPWKARKPYAPRARAPRRGVLARLLEKQEQEENS